jgi:hypothetical protein
MFALLKMTPGLVRSAVMIGPQLGLAGIAWRVVGGGGLPMPAPGRRRRSIATLVSYPCSAKSLGHPRKSAFYRTFIAKCPCPAHVNAVGQANTDQRADRPCPPPNHVPDFADIPRPRPSRPSRPTPRPIYRKKTPKNRRKICYCCLRSTQGRELSVVKLIGENVELLLRGIGSIGRHANNPISLTRFSSGVYLNVN